MTTDLPSIASVYIAAPLHRRGEATALAETLRARGCAITSTWHAAVADGMRDHDLTDKERIAACDENEACVSDADVLVIFADAAGRGSLVEYGLARGTSKEVHAIGVRREHTLMLEGAEWHATADECVEAICWGAR